MQLGRNDRCHCGSGKKYKHCHMSVEAPGASSPLSIALTVMKPADTQQPLVVRECGGCTACCGPALMINDPELVKPGGSRCHNLCQKGCAIHGEGMPSTCSRYLCNYLVDRTPLTEADRPDQVGAIVRLARHHDSPPPMNRATFVNECAPRGIERVLRSAAWSGIIRRDLRAGHPLLISRLDDAHCVEPVIVRYRDNRLGCELVSCEADGTPLLASVEPVFRDVILLGLVIPNQGFQLDANTLLDRLGRNDRVTIGSPKQSEDATSLHFLFTRWQARVLRRLRLLLHTHRPSPPVGAVSAS